MKSRLIIILSFFIFTDSLLADYTRTVTIKNQCGFDVLWGITGTPIKNNGNTVTCSDVNTSCFNDLGVCGNNNTCYFKYPELIAGNDSNPDFYLKSGVSKDYKIHLINRTDPGNTEVIQYTLNIGAQHNCSYDTKTQMYSCKSANCERDNSPPINGQCKPDTGLQLPYTQAEITFNDGQNDFYDVSIINGVNVPVSITPVGTFATGQIEMQKQLFSKPTGELPSGNLDNPAGCTWKFTPPSNAELKQHIFTQIDRDLTVQNINTTCLTDTDCLQNQKCGLKYPEDLKSYDGTGYCGMPLGYYTVTDICSLGGVATKLQNIFKCQKNIFYADGKTAISESAPTEDRCPDDYTTLSLNGVPNSERKFCNYEIYQCKTQVFNIEGKDYKYLDSCYNYNVGDPQTSACCGCIDWPNAITDDNNLCLTSLTQAEPIKCDNPTVRPPYCKMKNTTKISGPNQTWLDLVKPHLQWLVEGCPDAYDYQYGDKHGTMQCSSQDTAIEPGNSINYIITFCPNGQGLFSGAVYEDLEIEYADGNINNLSFIKAHGWKVLIIFLLSVFLTVLGLYLFRKRP